MDVSWSDPHDVEDMVKKKVERKTFRKTHTDFEVCNFLGYKQPLAN